MTTERMSEMAAAAAAGVAMMSAAQTAKQRKRGRSVLERRREEEAAAAAVESVRPRATAAPVENVAPQLESTGGKRRKSGMVLARAQLSASASGVVAAQERQDALLCKGTYREAEKVAREAPVGSLATKDMPKRKASEHSEAVFAKQFYGWMRKSLKAKVRLGKG